VVLWSGRKWPSNPARSVIEVVLWRLSVMYGREPTPVRLVGICRARRSRKGEDGNPLRDRSDMRVMREVASPPLK
jgi:hypothetical protein